MQELRCAAPTERTVKAHIDVLNAHLMQAHAEGRRVVLIVDEAQTLSPELLEQVRLLTNLETSKQKLLQIILIGQPELRELLDRPEMRQIAQRITGRYHLEPLRKGRHARVREPPAARRRRAERHLHEIARSTRSISTRAAFLGSSTSSPTARCSRRIRRIGAASTRSSCRPRPPRCSVFGAGRRGGRSRPRPPALRPSCSASRTWETAARAQSRAPSSFSRAGAPADTDLAVDLPPSTPPQPRRRRAPTARADAPATATLTALLADPNFALTTDEAIGELLALWGAHYDAARGEPCVQAQEQGLRCLFQRRGTLGELRRVNWPTILSLVTADGADHPVVVAALGYDHAQLVANGSTFELPLAELSYYWFGDHLLLWRPGDAPARDLAPGVDDVGVRWLRDTLAKLAGEPAPTDASTLYDDALEQRVRAYQRAHQLTVDGIVGARTQIAMLAELDLPDTPALVKDH